MPRSDRSSAPRLGKVDLTRKLDRPVYEKNLLKRQTRLSRIQPAYLLHQHAGVIIFE